MVARTCTLLAGVLAALFCAGCATSPDVEAQRQAQEAGIQEILSLPLDPTEFGGARRCLADHEIRNFYALDDHRIIFEGRGDKLWINTLHMRCPDLRWGTVLRVESFSWSRICDMDTFEVGDWFDWPWYRRWPWHWGRWESTFTCTLGKFQPVSEEQLAEIEALLQSRR